MNHVLLIFPILMNSKTTSNLLPRLLVKMMHQKDMHSQKTLFLRESLILLRLSQLKEPFLFRIFINKKIMN